MHLYNIIASRTLGSQLKIWKHASTFWKHLKRTLPSSHWQSRRAVQELFLWGLALPQHLRQVSRGRIPSSHLGHQDSTTRIKEGEMCLDIGRLFNLLYLPSYFCIDFYFHKSKLPRVNINIPQRNKMIYLYILDD